MIDDQIEHRPVLRFYTDPPLGFLYLFFFIFVKNLVENPSSIRGPTFESFLLSKFSAQHLVSIFCNLLHPFQRVGDVQLPTFTFLVWTEPNLIMVFQPSD